MGNLLPLLLLPTAVLVLVVTYITWRLLESRRRVTRSVAFFHPYTNDGGGGERVLWCAVKAIQEQYPELEVFVYSGDQGTTSDSLLARAVDRFGVKLVFPPKIVCLEKRKWIEESTYPRFTMIGQSLGSIYLAWEALCKLTPRYFFDTSGFAFTYPLARLFGCRVLCYVHYPTISLDMISRVRGRNSMYNNDSIIARSAWLSKCKMIYYTIFSWLYGFVGSFAHLSMVNSSWTQSHIETLWKVPSRTKRIYPPCDTSMLQALPLERSAQPPRIISVAQFRPEKAHLLQLEAFSLMLNKLESESPRPKLLFVGSCRNKQDEARLTNLQTKARELMVNDYVEFHKNVIYRDLVDLLGGAICGLHSMIDEHFGISVVEYMAAGVIPIAHNSAGPKMDIVLEENGHQTGFLAENLEQYADAMLTVIQMSEKTRLDMATAARRRAERFSEQMFYKDFKAPIKPVFEGYRRS